ncbi:MAG: 30S ribosomal protein S19e [Candidatus Aenigmatarchaeota archaeon]|nr:30S ribosomal protein S19e [Candidatus Aenigmarchaeota archaeon]
MTAKDVPAQKLINEVAKALEAYKEIQPPLWSKFTKTGVCCERPPIQDNFWYLRCASILRKLYISNTPIGVRKLQTVYGKLRRRGHKPPHHRKAGGKIIRLMLQQLEKAGFITKTEKPKKGRIITPKGIKFLDKVSNKIGE